MENIDRYFGEQISAGPLCFFLGLYAPAPAPYTPDDWLHRGEENVAAWAKFIHESVERGYFAAPIMENDTTEGMK